MSAAQRPAPISVRAPILISTTLALAALLLAGCAGGGSGASAGSTVGAQTRALPKGTSAAVIRRFCTEEARRQAESIPAIQSGKTSYTGGKDHDFAGCLKRHGL